MTLTGSGDETNYTYTAITTDLSNIAAATLTYTANTAARLYGMGNPSFSGTVTGFVNGESQLGATTGTLAFGSTATATTNVGTYAINGSGLTANNGNYIFVQAAGNATALTINAATLTYTANTAARLYGVANPSFSGTVTGFANGETQLGATTGTLAFGSTAVATTSVGTYAINGSGLTANNGNYVFVQAAGNATALTINAATLTYTANTAARLYGVGNPIFSGTVTGFANGETQLGATTGTLAFGSTATATTNIGTYAINGSGLTANNGNYVFVQAAGNATALAINAATLTYTANPVARLYGVGNPSFGGTVTGFANGETQLGATTGALAFGSAAVATTSVGTYAINGSGLTANNGNYVFVQAAANATALTINPALLTITADSKSRAFGIANPALTATYLGLVNNEPSTVVSGLSLATSAVTNSPVGSYPITATGATAANYTIAFVNGILAVGQNLLTITANNLSKIYGAALPAFTASYAGLLNGDTSSVVTGVQFSTTATASSNVGTFAITPFGGTSASYALAYVPGILTINPAALTITASNASRLYGAVNPAFGASYVGLVNGDSSSVVSGLSLTTPATVASNVGSYAITPSSASAANYTIAYAPGALLVTPAALTVTADNKSKVYGAALPAFTASYAGFLNGDTASVVSGLTLTPTATAASGVGISTITPANAAAANYTITSVAGILTITPASLTITASNASRLYGAVNPAFGASYAGLVNGDTSSVVSSLSLATPATAASNVGSYAITPSAAVAANYAIAYAPGALLVTPAALTVTAANASKTYGAANPAFSATFGGFLNGDTSSIVSGLTFTTPATAASGVGAYAIVPAGATAPNYALTFSPGSLTINPAALTITADSKGKLYGAALPAFTASYAGFVNGDTASGVTGLTLTSPATAASGVGTSAITPASATAANYTITPIAGTLTINPAPLTITADSKSRAVGAANPTLTATYLGLVNNDTAAAVSGLSLATTALTNSPAGSYPITATGATAANYTLAFVNGVLAVGQNLLTITANNLSKIYGAALPTFTASYAGLLNGDTASVVTGLQFSTTATASSNVGTFAITPFGGTSASYALAYVPGLLTINPAALTITANNASRLYGAVNPAFGASYVGLVNGDSSSVVSGLSLTTPATVASNVGSYAITPSTASAANYTIAYAPGALLVTPAALTVTADNKSKLYGAELPAFTASYAGFLNGDTSSVVSGLTFTATATVASGVGTSAITPANAAAANYTITPVAGILTITPASLTITADNKSRAVGLANPTLTATYAGLVNNDTAAAVSGLSLATTALTNSPIGSYPITAAGATAANYTIAFVNGTLAIGQNLLTITANSLSKVYGAALPVFTASFAGLLNGDTSSVVTGLQFSTTATASSNVGTFTITPFGGTSSSYALAYVPGILTINRAALTITAGNASRLYGAVNPAFSASYLGLVNGDTSTVVSGLSLATPATVASNVGSYAITPAAASAANYTIAYAPGALLVTPAALTVTAANASKTYGAANPAFNASFLGFVNGDTSSIVSGLALTTPATTASNVGSYAITPSAASAANYTIAYAPGALLVTPAALTVTAANASKTYGAANPVFSATFGGFVNGDTSSMVSGLGFTTPATAASGVGSYAIVPAGATAPNYALTFVPGTLTINPALLAILADSKTRAFGAANPAFTATYTGFVNGDTSSVVSGLQLATTASASSPSGNYAITAAGATAANYAISFAPGILAIGQNLLTITANSLSKIYGAALPVFTASYAGLLNSDTPSVVTGLQFSTTATASSNVGTFAITPFGGTSASYALAYVPGILTISPAALSLAANSATRIYGAANPAFGATYAGFVNGDTAAVVTGLQFTTPATTASGVGGYAITPSGAVAQNYTLTFVPGTLTISRASLTLTAADATRPVGAANPVFTDTITGFVNGDTAAVVTGLLFSTPANAASVAADYSIVPFSATAANYTLSFVNGTLHVTTPTVVVDTTPLPASTVTQQLTNTLGDATSLPAFAIDTVASRGAATDGASSMNTPNFGAFDLVTTFGNGAGGGGSGGGGAGFSAAQLNEPGLYRESTVSMGGFNVVYHEAIADVREQAASNTALGSSYREFSDADNPQVNLVRAKVERKRAEPAAGTGASSTL